jgi:hypothetical protein
MRALARKFFGQQFCPACMMVEMAHGQRNIHIARLAQGFAVIQRLQHRKQALALLDLARDGIKMARARSAGQARPCGKSGARACDSRVYILRAALGDLRQHLIPRGVGGVKQRAGGCESATYEMPERPARQPIAGQSFAFGCGAIVHSCQNLRYGRHVISLRQRQPVMGGITPCHMMG